MIRWFIYRKSAEKILSCGEKLLIPIIVFVGKKGKTHINVITGYFKPFYKMKPNQQKQHSIGMYNPKPSIWPSYDQIEQFIVGCIHKHFDGKLPILETLNLQCPTLQCKCPRLFLFFSILAVQTRIQGNHKKADEYHELARKYAGNLFDS